LLMLRLKAEEDRKLGVPPLGGTLTVRGQPSEDGIPKHN